MPGLYAGGSELKSWQNDCKVLLFGAQDVLVKMLKAFFFGRCSGTYAITDVTVHLKGRNKPWQFSAQYQIKLSNNLMFNQRKSKYLEAHALGKKMHPMKYN